MVITFYTTQQRCYRRIFADLPGVEYKTVDGSQGNKRTIVIVDCVTPGGDSYSMGSSRDLHRK